MIFNSIKSGIAQMWAYKLMVLVFYLVNLLFGLIIMLPFRSIVSKFVGHSLMGAKLAGRFDMNFLFEFLKYNNAAPVIIAVLVIIVAAVYWLFALFLSGGALSIFASNEKYTLTLLLSNSAKYFGRFLRLVLWCMPVFVILF